MTASHVIRIDHEVAAELQRRARGFETRNAVVRRAMGLDTDGRAPTEGNMTDDNQPATLPTTAPRATTAGDVRVMRLKEWLEAIGSHGGRVLADTDHEYIGLSISRDGKPFIYQVFKDGTPEKRILGFEIFVPAFGANDVDGTLGAATEALTGATEAGE